MNEVIYLSISVAGVNLFWKVLHFKFMETKSVNFFLPVIPYHAILFNVLT